MKRFLLLLPLLAAATGCIKPISSGSDPTPVEGNSTLYALQVSNSDGLKVLAAPASGQLARSEEAGASWYVLSASPNRDWSALASSGDGKYLAAIGRTTDAAAEAELWLSANFGAGWSKVSLPADTLTGALAMGQTGAALLVGGTAAVYRSTDYGATWTALSAINSVAPSKVVVVSGDGTKQMVLSGDADRHVSLVGVGVDTAAVFSAATGGTSWPAQTASGTWTAGLMNSDGSRRILLSTEGTTSYAYLSSDNGGHWTKTALPIVADRLAADRTLASVYLLPPSKTKARPYKLTGFTGSWQEQTQLPSLYWLFLAANTDGSVLQMGGSQTSATSASSYLAYRTQNGTVTLQSGAASYAWTVTFDASNGESTHQTAVVASPAVSVANPPVPTQANMHFVRWKTSAGATFDAGTVVTGDLTVTAEWTGQPVVIFNANGGTGTMANLPVDVDTSANLTANGFTRTGYTFAGWATTSGGAVAYTDGQSYHMATASDVTLYARWTANTYSISFDSTGGSAVSAVTGTYDQLISAPAAPSLTGYTFAGWYKESGLTNAWIFASDKVAGAATLYAKWTANTYTISFNSNGGSAVSAVTGTYNQLLSAPPAPTFTGYTFAGWYKESGLTNAWVFASDKVTGAATLYAKWTANTYTVTFNGNTNDGGSMTPESFTFGSPQALTSNLFTKTGYTFAGWALTSGGAAAYTDAQSYSATASITLYAKWTPNQTVSVTVSFPVGTTSTVTAAGTIAQGTTLTAVLSGTVSGIQWYLDGNALAGKTASTLNLDTAGLPAGFHELVVLATTAAGVSTGRVEFEVTN